VPRSADAVVLVSGGLDSCVTLARAFVDCHGVALLHATYGQRTAARERASFDAIADHYSVPLELRLVLDLSFLGSMGGSALTDARVPVPEGLPGKGVPTTYVPFRNGLLLSAAVSWAEVLEADSVWIGVVEEDGSGYPDCRESFLAAFESAARLGSRTGESMRVLRPLVGLRKSEIVRLGFELHAPLPLTWSCYRSTESACGRCESCILRLRGFEEAGVADPIRYDDDGTGHGV